MGVSEPQTGEEPPAWDHHLRAEIGRLWHAVRRLDTLHGIQTINFTVTGAETVPIAPGKGLVLAMIGYDSSGNGYPVTLTDGPPENLVMLTGVPLGGPDIARANTANCYAPLPYVNGLYAVGTDADLAAVITVIVSDLPE